MTFSKCNAVRIETSSPDAGTVIFIAKVEGVPVEGVEIRVDGESRGFTGERGELSVDWMLSGEHFWKAAYDGEEICAGEFKISEITKVEYLGTWCELPETKGVEVYEWNPLKDVLCCCVGIKNTGTTIIDHFTCRLTIHLIKPKMKLLKPKLPSKLWRPFAGDISTHRSSMEIAVRGDQIEATNPTLQRSHKAVARTPLEGKGVRPGETLIVEQEEDFLRLLEESVEALGAEMKTEAQLKVIDKDKGVAEVVIGEYKFGPISLHDVVIQMVFKARIQALDEVFIDDQKYGSREVSWEYV